MGCCNKTIEEVPIHPVRYWVGTLILGLVLLGFFVTLTVLGRVRPRYRRLAPFYREYARDVWHSIRERERILVGRRCAVKSRGGLG